MKYYDIAVAVVAHRRVDGLNFRRSMIDDGDGDGRRVMRHKTVWPPSLTLHPLGSRVKFIPSGRFRGRRAAGRR